MVLGVGVAATIAGTAIGLKKIDYDEIPSTGILSAAFFVASLIHVPVGFSSSHLILNGLVGLILGWRAFPAILVGLLLQALLFQFGGITTLGINTFNMAFPAVVCRYLFGWGIRKNSGGHLIFTLAAFGAGSFAVFLSGIFTGLSLYFTGEAFLPVIKLLIAVHLPIMVIEGILTFSCVLFLKKVKPEFLEMTYVQKSQ